MPPRGSTRSDVLAHAALLLLALALHGRFVVRGEALMSWDQTAVGTPWRRPAPAGAPPRAMWNALQGDTVFWEGTHTWHHVRRGAEWNPYSSLGEPEGTFTHPFHAYPPARLAYALLEPWRAKGWLTLLHVALGGAAMLRYLRWRGASVHAGLAGAAAYQLSTEITVWLEYSQRAALAAWAPLVLWGVEATVRTLGPAAAALTALAVAGGLLGGLSEQAGVLLLVAAVLVAVVRAPADRRPRRVGLALLAIALGVGVAAARLLPMAAEFQECSRRHVSWSSYFEATCRLGPRHALTLLLPDLLGNPARHPPLDLLTIPAQQQPWANYAEIRLYFGLPALLLAALGAAERRERAVAAIVALTALMAFPTPLTWLPFQLVPGFAASGPVRILWVTHLLLPLLVCAGAERLARGPGRAPLALAGASCALVLLIGAVVSTPAGAARLVPDEWGATPAQRQAMGQALASRFDLTARSAALQRLEGEGRSGWTLSPTLGPLLLALATLGAVALAASGGGRRRRAGVAALLGLLALDLLDRGVVYNATAPPAALFPTTPGIERARALAGADRAALDHGLYPNVLLPFGVRDVGGYLSMHPARVTALYAAIATPNAFVNVLQPADAAPAWRDALAVRALLTLPGRPPSRPEGLVLDRAGDDVDVWANPTALPRARLHAPQAAVTCADRAAALEVVTAGWFDPRRHVVVEGGGAGPAPPRAPPADAPPARPLTIALDEAERVVVEVDAPQGGVVVLADTFTAGWRARGPDGPLPVRPADVALRAVEVPPGFRGQVAFEYDVPGRTAGRAITLASLAGALLLLHRGRRAVMGAGSA